MVTAADGAEQFYTSQNNEARYETVEMAKELDKKLPVSMAVIMMYGKYVGHY